MIIPLFISLLQEGISGLVAIYISNILARFSDAVIHMETKYVLENLWILLLCIAIMIFLMPILGYFCNILMLKHALLHDRLVIRRFLDKNYMKAMEIEKGEVQYRLENDPNDYRIEWMEWMTKIIVTPVIFVFLITFAIKVNWFYALITFSLSLIKLVIPVAMKKRYARYDRETRDYNTDVRNYEMEISSKPHTVILFGLKSAFLDKLDSIYYQYYKRTAKEEIRYKTIFTNISLGVDTIFLLFVLLIGAVLTSLGTITAGSVAAMVGYYSIFNTVIDSVSYIIRQRPILNNLIQRLEVIYNDQESSTGENISSFSGTSIHIPTFYYGDKRILYNLNHQINHGEKVAICGSNGSGKSTIIKLLTVLVAPQIGSITINDIELNEIAIESWRSLFAFTMQNPYLFKGNVIDNMTFGNEKLNKSAKDLLEYLGIPLFTDKEVSEGGNNLSGGEKQKISIARAILKKAPILILDEPTNHLDTNSKKWLAEYIQNTDKTVIYVTHDKAFLEIATSIITL
jgi:ATP-binding cassette subfamily B protein